MPNHDRVVVYTAGWAAKYVPILGEMIARMLEGPIEEFDFGRYRIDRSHFAIDWEALPAAAATTKGSEG